MRQLGAGGGTATAAAAALAVTTTKHFVQFVMTFFSLLPESRQAESRVESGTRKLHKLLQFFGIFSFLSSCVILCIKSQRKYSRDSPCCM